MFANSIHLIDYFSLLCRGELKQTEIVEPWSPDNPDSVIAYLKYSSGDLGIYHATWNAPGPWSVAVSTQESRLELRPIEQLLEQQRGSRNIISHKVDDYDTMFKPGLYRQAQAAVLAARGEPSTLPSLSEANQSMSVISSIYGIK